MRLVYVCGRAAWGFEMEQDIRWWADAASIATFFVTAVSAVIGIGGYLSFVRARARKVAALEAYLKREKAQGNDSGQRSALKIIRHVGLTEDEIIDISFNSPRVARRLGTDEEGYANRLLFEFVNTKDEG